MLNELIEKMMGLTWTVTHTGARATVELKDGFIAQVENNGYQIILKIGSWETYPTTGPGSHYRPGEKYWLDKAAWHSGSVTPSQSEAMAALFDSAVTNGTDKKVAALLDLVG